MELISQKMNLTLTTAKIKNLTYLPLFLIGLSGQSYVILVIFMGVDIVSGIWKATVLHGPRAVKSYKITAGIISKLSVVTIPLLVVWTGKGVGIDLFFLAKGALNGLILAQAYSIHSNLTAIYTRQDLEESDAVNIVLKRVRSGFEWLLSIKKKDNA